MLPEELEKRRASMSSVPELSSAPQDHDTSKAGTSFNSPSPSTPQAGIGGKGAFETDRSSSDDFFNSSDAAETGTTGKPTSPNQGDQFINADVQESLSFSDRSSTDSDGFPANGSVGRGISAETNAAGIGSYSPPPVNPRETEAEFSGAKAGRVPPKRPKWQNRPKDSDFRDTQPVDLQDGDSLGEPETGPSGAMSSSATEPIPQPADPQQLSVVREAAAAETIAAEDALDREALTNAVADLLTTRKDKHPLAIALFGAWGAGKSSFIHFVKKELATREATHFKFAEFNAWRNERVDNIGAALAQSVVESLVTDRSFTQQVSLALKLASRRKERLRKALTNDTRSAWAWLQRKWMSLSTAIIYFAWPIAVGLISISLVMIAETKWIVATLTTAATGLTALITTRIVLSKELLDWFKKLAKDQKFTFKFLPDYTEKLGSYHEMGRTLEDLCALILTSPKNNKSASEVEFLMLVIDDLDRCSPETIKQVFDAVRLVANIPQVLVLVALDERIAYSAVAKHYAEYGFSDRETAQVARDYLSKVFNVFISLPSAQEKSIANYVRTRLFDIPSSVMTSSDPSPLTAPPEISRPRPTETSSQLEVETFAALVNEFGLANPRELWRLRQTWSLLKGFALKQHATDDEIRICMRHMFFREMFLRGTADQRNTAKPVIEKLASGTGLDNSDALWSPTLTKAATEIKAGFAQRDAAVMTVLLPAAPAELKVKTASG